MIFNFDMSIHNAHPLVNHAEPRGTSLIVTALLIPWLATHASCDGVIKRPLAASLPSITHPNLYGLLATVLQRYR
jgi:hypothetical protein